MPVRAEENVGAAGAVLKNVTQPSSHLSVKSGEQLNFEIKDSSQPCSIDFTSVQEGYLSIYIQNVSNNVLPIYLKVFNLAGEMVWDDNLGPLGIGEEFAWTKAFRARANEMYTIEALME